MPTIPASAGGGVMNGCCADKPYGTGCTEQTCMDLPKGSTCGQCAHFARCQMLFQCKAERTECDWFPRRFRLAQVQP